MIINSFFAQVVTHAKDEKVRNKWIQNNQQYFRANNLIFVAETTVCGTPIHGLSDEMQCYFKNCLLESRFDVLRLIQDKSLKQPYRIPELNFLKLICAMFNFVLDYFGFPIPLWTELSDFLQEHGFDPLEAIRRVNAMFH